MPGSPASQAAQAELDRRTKPVSPLEIADENEQEAEALLNGINFDRDLEASERARAGADDSDREEDREASPPQTSAGPHERVTIDRERWAERLRRSSENVVVPSTRTEYEKKWTDFVVFCEQYGFIISAEEFVAACARGATPGDTPTWIAYWIMKKCDRLDPETGIINPLEARAGYGTAQKMRAAISHKFCRDFEQEDREWSESHFFPGRFTGNPSLSHVVGQYMCSLRRTKVHDGELSISAAAIDEETMRKLYTYNSDMQQFPPDLTPDAPARKRQTRGSWDAAYSLRCMLNFAFILAFLCLLRFDEVLGIQWHWFALEELSSGVVRLKVCLPFRKTHQTGGVAPFYLYTNARKPWLCPIRAFILWMNCTKDARGFVFRRKVGHTCSQQPEDGMSADSFLSCFRNNLLDVGVDGRPYGTHSFRRGGCQYLAVTLRWPLRDVCTWGGWAENFDSPGTIFKYLLSLVDKPTVPRDDYFNPDRKKAETCPECGRSCHCA